MSKKKGLSIEEKVVKCEEYFHENQVPFTLKELMVNIPKAKGVIFQSIEECLEVLISEGRIRQEKIGISVFYWYFPVDLALKKRVEAEELVAKAGRLEAQLAAKEAQYRELLAEKFGGNEAALLEAQSIMHEIREKEAYERHLEAEISLFADKDPLVLAQLQRAHAMALEGANRWTDNIFLIEDFVTKRMNISRKEFREMARIPPKIDFLE